MSAKNRKFRKQFTVAEAFDLFFNFEDDNNVLTPLNCERSVRAVAFLLHWCSEIGNKDVGGFIAHGLADVLEYTADQFPYLKAQLEKREEYGIRTGEQRKRGTRRKQTRRATLLLVPESPAARKDK